jgi:aspartyl-tRNA(Asn)/glutamyl-tRNA(Gln) amidotransferase subunit A
LELSTRTAHELHNMLVKKEVSSREITEAVLGRIEQVEGQVSAYITVTADAALAAADAADESFAKGDAPGLLTGIPVALKDNLCTKGVKTTCASKILKNFVPPYNATAIDKLANMHAVPIGKSNLDEFAMGSSTENSIFYPTKNPWNLSCVPGGSSGGSAAAVAADEAIVALGSDTGGSIRQPASFCGVVGMKPTSGRVSRYGLIAFASSLDQIGPLTKDVTDCAMVLQSISGKDPMDSICADVPVPDYLAALKDDVKGLKIGVPKEFFVQGIDSDVSAAVWKAVELLKSLGAECGEHSMPVMEYTLPAYYILAPSEASSNLARHDGVRYGFRSAQATDVDSMFQKTREEGFGPEVKQRIMIGTYALSAGYYDAYYRKAQQVRTLVRQSFEEAYSKFDVLITPTTPTVAFGLGERSGNPLEMKLTDVCTIPASLSGIPAISITCGYKNNLPIGLQIMGKHFDEETLLRVAYTFEQNTSFHKNRPALGRE